MLARPALQGPEDEVMTAQHIEEVGEDYALCLCGNATHLDGYSCSNPVGDILEDEVTGMPTDAWDGDTVLCRSCGRLFHWSDGLIIGQRDFATQPLVLEVDPSGAPVDYWYGYPQGQS